MTLVDRGRTADIEAITKCVRDYAEGWYTADPVRMRRALHPDLSKRTIIRDPFREDVLTVGEPTVTTADRMVRLTANGGGRDDSAGDGAVEVEVVHLWRDMAMAACKSRDFMDCLQLGRFGRDGWKIVNALWQPLEGYHDPAKWSEQEAAFWTPAK